MASCKSFEEKKSKSLRTATQLRLVISLYLANRHTLGPTKLLLQPPPRVCLGKKLRGRTGRPRLPSWPPLLSHTPHSTEQDHWSCPQVPTPVWSGGLRCSTATCGRLSPAPGTDPLLLKASIGQGPLPPAVGMSNPFSPALKPVPTGQEAKCTKILL